MNLNESVVENADLERLAALSDAVGHGPHIEGRQNP